MAGIVFSFMNFESLISLNIGIADRIDENRSESFTILFCDFDAVERSVIDTSLQEILRTSDAIVHYDNYYFFVLPYTDKYGATIVKNMFEEFFNIYIPSSVVSYPVNGETAKDLLEALQTKVKIDTNLYLECLDI